MNALRMTDAQFAAHQAKRTKERTLTPAPAADHRVHASSAGEGTNKHFALVCIADGLPPPVAEFKFHPTRKWRFDFAWPDKLLAVEFDGAIWTQGRHTRGAGYLEDMHKLNAAVLLGWSVLRFAPDEVSEALSAIRLMLA